MKSFIEKQKGVVSVEYTSALKGLEDFKERHKGDVETLKKVNELTQNPVGAKMVLKLSSSSDRESVLNSIKTNTQFSSVETINQSLHEWGRCGSMKTSQTDLAELNRPRFQHETARIKYKIPQSDSEGYFIFDEGQDRDEKAGAMPLYERSELRRVRRGRQDFCEAKITGDRVLVGPPTRAPEWGIPLGRMRRVNGIM